MDFPPLISDFHRPFEGKAGEKVGLVLEALAALINQQVTLHVRPACGGEDSRHYTIPPPIEVNGDAIDASPSLQEALQGCADESRTDIIAVLEVGSISEEIRVSGNNRES